MTHMSDTGLAGIGSQLLLQEEMLQFDHFTNWDAWDLGCVFVQEIRSAGIDLAVCIRKLNGNILFQFATEKTCLDNQIWMQRKFCTVSLMERSSLAAAVQAKIKNQGVAFHGLDEKDYAFCGGGFPIRVRGAGMAAVITVSNLPNVKDHGFIVRCLAKYLKVTGVPEIDAVI